MFTGTWNVNAKGKDEPLDDWLCADWGPNYDRLPDMVAVGFQEIVDLNAVNVAVDNKTQQRSQFWVERLNATLNSKNPNNDPNRRYVLVAQKSMVGLLVCVFVRYPHHSRVKYVNTSNVGVGVMGMMGNKGGVSIRLQFYDSSLCFVCSHLAAHRENVTGRNADFANVFQKTTFDVGDAAIREVIRSGSLSHFATQSTTVGLADHDHTFWLGDLNYRIDESMQTEQVLKMSEACQSSRTVPAELRQLDQLNMERAAGRVFEGFKEGVLQFAPTYKYQPGTDMYEQRPDKKLRAPAWCDRILWMSQQEEHVQQLTYARSERPNCSDHKPVYSSLKLTVKDVIQEKRESIYAELTALLGRYENPTPPMIGLDQVALDFGPIRFNESKSLPIRITNTGSVVAIFRFVPKPDEVSSLDSLERPLHVGQNLISIHLQVGICKRWLSVKPAFGMLVPGDQPLTVKFTITIDSFTAQLLNSGREILDDIVILRLEDGRDYYITIKATFARSCFGMSADELVMYSDPIRSIPIDPLERAKKVDPHNTSSALCVPKELWRCVDAIYQKGLSEPHLFVEPGIPSETSEIRESLDTGTAFGRFSIHSYAETLVSFLSSLSPSIVPTKLFPSVEIDSQTIQSSARRLVEDLPPIHYNIFVYVISFFRHVLAFRDRNLLTAAKVARVCVNSLAPGRDLDNSASSLQKRTGMQLIVLHLLETSSI